MAVTLGVASALVAAQPAHATPTNCDRPPLISANWARSWCHNGTGQHRLRVTCVDFYGSKYVVYSPWKAAGQLGYANCNTTATPVNVEGSNGWQYQLR